MGRCKSKTVLKCLIILALTLTVFPSRVFADATANDSILAAGRLHDQRIEIKLYSQENETPVNVIVASYSDEGKMLDFATKRTNVSILGTDIEFDNLASGKNYRAFVVDNSFRPYSSHVEVQSEEAFFVTFSDFDGRAVSVQAVPRGEDAIAPPDPYRSEYSFEGWDGTYTGISEDLTLTAQYIEGPIETYSVTFYDDDGVTVLKEIPEVRKGSCTVPPESPTKEGAAFLGWNGQYADVVEDSSVVAVYSDAKNVFCISPSEGRVGGTATVLISLKGQVKTCGFDLSILYDDGLELVSYDDDYMDIVVNTDAYSNGIKLNYSATRDLTKSKDIIELTFRIKNGSKVGMPVWISMNSIYEIVSNDPAASDYHLTNSAIMIKK